MTMHLRNFNGPGLAFSRSFRRSGNANEGKTGMKDQGIPFLHSCEFLFGLAATFVGSFLYCVSLFGGSVGFCVHSLSFVLS